MNYYYDYELLLNNSERSDEVVPVPRDWALQRHPFYNNERVWCTTQLAKLSFNHSNGCTHSWRFSTFYKMMTILALDIVQLAWYCCTKKKDAEKSRSQLYGTRVPGSKLLLIVHAIYKIPGTLLLYYGVCGYHVPGPTRLGKMSKPLLPLPDLCFWKPCSGNSGDCHVWKLATEPSPHSADGSSRGRIYRLADSPQRDFGRPRWMVFWPECRGSDDNCSPSALTYHLSLSVNGLLS